MTKHTDPDGDSLSSEAFRRLAAGAPKTVRFENHIYDLPGPSTLQPMSPGSVGGLIKRYHRPRHPRWWPARLRAWLRHERDPRPMIIDEFEPHYYSLPLSVVPDDSIKRYEAQQVRHENDVG